MTETRYLQTQQPDAIQIAAEYLIQGQLVVFPTDTVYGVGVDAFNGPAIERLYRVKQRPLAKGIPILLADADDLNRVAQHIPTSAAHFIERFWPGPLTLIVPRHPQLPALISPNSGIAVRLPDCSAARALIRAAGGAVAATSANFSGEPPALNGVEGMALNGLVTAVLDDGPAPGGTPSTIVDCTGDVPQILRHGPIKIADLSLAGVQV